MQKQSLIMHKAALSFFVIYTRYFLSICALLLCCIQSSLAELSGYIGAETRVFTQVSDEQLSLTAEPEFYWEIPGGKSTFTASVFGRYDSVDDQRTSIDVREFVWVYVADAWELHIGIDTVFWGVTESNHLVDIINQTDFADSVDGEKKLGQAMIQWSTVQDWGIIDAFVLPYFRERRFPGIEGRLGAPFPIVHRDTEYESGGEEHHIDWALRYSQTFGRWDIGLSHFQGTNRDPLLLPRDQNAQTVLVPYYDQITQTGVSVQVTLDAWLLKLESIYRDTSVREFSALSTGFEYTLYGISDSAKDLGLLVEYNYDERQEESDNPLQDDIFVGARLTFNDVQSTDFLLGISADLQFDDSYAMFIEANRRIGDSWKITLDSRVFSAKDKRDPSFAFEAEDYVSGTLEYYF